ncbi:NAD(P)-binding domain-containing protein [Klebsiella pneumoniae]|nr:NAD(P)-binding domain-containing protein [Klebsiella pneumoniae]UYS05485.1 NAD(P)-binding domain-containing protein [Klebsiella pneumoniae]
MTLTVHWRFSAVKNILGKTYASYLKAVLDEYQIPVMAPARIAKVALLSSGNFILITEAGEKLETRSLIWATGEFQFPDRQIFLEQIFVAITVM